MGIRENRTDAIVLSVFYQFTIPLSSIVFFYDLTNFSFITPISTIFTINFVQFAILHISPRSPLDNPAKSVYYHIMIYHILIEFG